MPDDDLRAVADAVLTVHDRMESSGAKQVSTDRVLEYLARVHGFSERLESGDPMRLAAVLNEHHGELWIVGPREGDHDMPAFVLVPEEMALVIEEEVLGKDGDAA